MPLSWDRDNFSFSLNAAVASALVEVSPIIVADPPEPMVETAVKADFSTVAKVTECAEPLAFGDRLVRAATDVATDVGGAVCCAIAPCGTTGCLPLAELKSIGY